MPTDPIARPTPAVGPGWVNGRTFGPTAAGTDAATTRNAPDTASFTFPPAIYESPSSRSTCAKFHALLTIFWVSVLMAGPARSLGDLGWRGKVIYGRIDRMG